MARLFQNFNASNGYHKRLLFETEKYTTHNLPWKNKMLTYSLKPTCTIMGHWLSMCFRRERPFKLDESSLGKG